MEIEHLITQWHIAVNARDKESIAEIVGKDILLGGPKGESSGLNTVIDWVDRSGITLTDVNWHPISPNEMVVEESATWPGSETATSIFTRYRSDGKLLVSIHRYNDLHAALNNR